ncbi:MAG: ABC transporter substrate-binding protein [Actinomycetota bacterium]|nr:ABC transporter substrate-binding protein [Actinomycetota bacterium]
MSETLAFGATNEPPTHVLTYNSLLEWDRNLLVKNALAESWQAVDNVTYDIKLRRGVKFHSGKEMVAEDVKYTIDLLSDPPAPGRKFSTYPKIASTEIVDPYTVRVKLSAPDPSLIGFMTWTRYSAILPKGLHTRINVQTEEDGTGPYKLTKFIANDSAVLARNPNYWGAPLPYPDEITLKVLPDAQARVAALRAGAIDGGLVSPDIAKTLASDSSISIIKGLVATHREIQFTVKTGEKKPWHDIRVRQAISKAINRQDIADKVYAGDAFFSSVVAPGYGDWSLPEADLKSNYLKFDLAAAKKLMTDAGYANGFQVVLQTFAAPADFAQVAQVVQEQLKQIGVDATVRPLEAAEFGKNNSEGNYDMQLTARGMRGDVSGYVNEFNSKLANAKVWFTAWKNDELDKLLDDGLLTADLAQRKQIYTKAQQILLTELVHIPLVNPMTYLAVRTRVKNAYPSYVGNAVALREVSLEG